VKPVLVSMGEPAGVGPDLCLALAGHHAPLVVLGDKALLALRCEQLGLDVTLRDYETEAFAMPQAHELWVLSCPGAKACEAGVLNPGHAAYVMRLLHQAVTACLQGDFSALVTAPVHKAVLNEAGYAFTGHTEFLAHACGVAQVVMLLTCAAMKVALVTTHLPLRDVADAITPARLRGVIDVLHQALIRDFGVVSPTIGVAGLNPHAGESGYLGREELDIIIPTLDALRMEGIMLQGPSPADTLFTDAGMQGCDVLLAMYHDQGLPTLKYAGFHEAVNITLGLPIIRTSVDHGTALDLAGSGRAHAGSLLAAVQTAHAMAVQRERTYVTTD
jgi:4-hydroxythreonine-4-phosphate dehydrogenase